MLAESVRARLRTNQSRTELVAAEEEARLSQESLLAELAARMEKIGPLDAIRVTSAKELGEASPMMAGWVRRENAARHNVFGRAYFVLWRHADGLDLPAFLVEYLSDSSTAAVNAWPLVGSGGGGGGGAAFSFTVGSVKKPRSKCHHTLRLDGKSTAGLERFKIVMGTDEPADLARWRAAFGLLAGG